MKISDISIMVAATTNMVIGNGNSIPWHLPTDLKYFKEKTSGKTIIMGRKCWESIPDKFRPLPNRTNVVLTRNNDYEANGAEIMHNLVEALEIYVHNDKDEVFIIGGGQIYKEGFAYANKLYLTEIYDSNIEGDVYLEGFNPDEWVLDNISDKMVENDLTFQFKIYTRKDGNSANNS